MAKHCDNPECPYRKEHGAPAEYQGTMRSCLDCGSALVEGGVERVKPAPKPTSSAPMQLPWRPALVTLGAMIVSAILPRIPLPGVEGTSTALHAVGLGTLGIMPLVTGTLLVELAALLVPAWRPLRHGGALARAKLWRASLVVSLLVAMVQAFGIVRYLEAMRDYGVEVASPAVVGLTLVAGAALYIGLVQHVERGGVGSGYGAVLLGSTLAALFEPDRLTGGSELLGLFNSRGSGVVLLLALAAVFAVVLAQLQPKRGLQAPVSGDLPLDVGTALLALPTLLASWAPELGRLASGFLALGDNLLVQTAVVLALVVAFAQLFHRPAIVTAWWKRVDPTAPLATPDGVRLALRDGMLRAGGLFLGMAVVRALAVRLFMLPLSFAPALLLGAALLDLFRDLSFRARTPTAVALRPFHQLDQLAAARHLLDREGIPSHAQGEALRTLLQFFGPYVPVRLMVPAERAEAALGLVSAAFPGESAAA